MKTIAFALLAALLFLNACRTASYYSTPNDLHKIDGTLYLTNGKSVAGKLVIQTGNIFGRPVKVFYEDERQPMQFTMQEVTGYKIGNHFFERKKIKESLSLGQPYFFMKRLFPGTRKVRLYELLRKENVNKIYTRNIVEYYLELPNEKEGLVYPAGKQAFLSTPEEKTNKTVADGLSQ